MEEIWARLNKVAPTAIVGAVGFAFVALLIQYVETTYPQAVFLDGLMQVPLLQKWDAGTFTLSDAMQPWVEHRLPFYHLFFIANAHLFGLDAKAEPYWFVICYTALAVSLYFPFRASLKALLPESSRFAQAFAFLPILFAVFSLVHAPGQFMTTQFVTGTVVFAASCLIYSRIATGSKSWADVGYFCGAILFYVAFLSGAYLGGALISLIVGFAASFAISRRPSRQLLVATIFAVAAMVIYVVLTPTSSGSILSKFVDMLTHPFRALLALIAGLSGATLDMSTWQEVLRRDPTIVIANGLLLLAIGTLAVWRFFATGLHHKTIAPLLLIFYTLGTIFTVHLGRIEDWSWIISIWYSFHLMYFLVGVFWALSPDLVRMRHVWTVLAAASVAIVLPSAAFSNYWQSVRAPHIYVWLDAKRTAALNPTDENLDQLLWTRSESLAAITYLKERHLGPFRHDAAIEQVAPQQ